MSERRTGEQGRVWRVKFTSVRRTGRTVLSVGSQYYECEDDREDSEECWEPRL